MKIPESELVLNSDGSIYHLGIRPEHLADTVLTVGDPRRVARISRHFDRVEFRREKREFLTHTGWRRGRRLTVVSTGIGPDNIDIVVNELDALANIDLDKREPRAEPRALRLMRVGTCGCLQPGIPVDSLLISAFAIGLDNLLHFYDYAPTLPEATLMDELRAFLEQAGRLPVRPYAVAGSTTLRREMGDAFHSGITLTCPGFYAPQGRRLRLPTRLSGGMIEKLSHFEFQGEKVVNLEMETSALFGLGRLLGHRVASCNVVLANRRTGQFSPNPQAAIDNLIVEVLDSLAGCPE